LTESGAAGSRKLDAFGVDTRFVSTDPVLRTPLAFAFSYKSSGK
jgi:hypothetical protein